MTELPDRKLGYDRYFLINRTKDGKLAFKRNNRAIDEQLEMWVYCTEKIKLYQYTQTRNGENAETFLKGYTAYLVCDGYDGYNKLKNVTRCGCWAHARRKFYEALPADEGIRKTSRANEGFERINNCLISKGNTLH